MRPLSPIGRAFLAHSRSVRSHRSAAFLSAIAPDLEVERASGSVPRRTGKWRSAKSARKSRVVASGAPPPGTRLRHSRQTPIRPMIPHVLGIGGGGACPSVQLVSAVAALHHWPTRGVVVIAFDDALCSCAFLRSGWPLPRPWSSWSRPAMTSPLGWLPASRSKKVFSDIVVCFQSCCVSSPRCVCVCVYPQGHAARQTLPQRAPPCRVLRV